MEKYDKFFLDKCPCSKTCMLVFEQGHLSWKNVSRTIFASVNYLSSALLIKEILSYFPFTLPRKTCEGKPASINEPLKWNLKCPCDQKINSYFSLDFKTVK